MTVVMSLTKQYLGIEINNTAIRVRTGKTIIHLWMPLEASHRIVT